MDEFKALAGREIGVGRWHLVTQEQVNAFADLTGDHQYIHVDPERARQTPYGGTIAHGYFTLSLLPALIATRDGVQINLDARMRLNYGLNRVRFPAPVPVGKRIRVRTTVLSVEDAPSHPAGRGNAPSGSGAPADNAGTKSGAPPTLVAPAVIQVTWQQTVEVEGSDRPAMVAETITRFYL